MNEIEEIAGIRDLQKNWIGAVDGYEVLFNIKVFNTSVLSVLSQKNFFFSYSTLFNFSYIKFSTKNFV